MSSKINLVFRDFYPEDINQKVPDYRITRISTWVLFKMKEGWSSPENAIIDTGAHTSIIPYSVWNNVNHKITTEFEIQGLVNKEECTIPGWIGTVEFKFIDTKNNESLPFKINSLFSSIDEIPLLIGLKDIIDSIELFINYSSHSGYILDLRDTDEK